MQGSGAFGLEAAISSVIPSDGGLLVLVNCACGERILEIASEHGIDAITVRSPEDTAPDARALDAALAADPRVSHVAMVHCEPTTGSINPVEAYGNVVRAHGRVHLVDAMSSFGAYSIHVEASAIDYVVSSWNKNIEGVPGLSCVLAHAAAVTANRFGAGEAVYAGTTAEPAFGGLLVRWLVAEGRIAAPLDAPAGVEVTVRKGADGARYPFVLSGTAAPQRVDLGAGGLDLVSDRLVSGEVVLQPLQVMVVR